MSLIEWKQLEKDAERTVVKFAVDMSKYGPGVLHLTQTVYTNGGKFIFPKFIANAAKFYKCDGGLKQFEETITAPKGGYKNGVHAMRLMRERLDLKFKVAKFNTIHEDDPKDVETED